MTHKMVSRILCTIPTAFMWGCSSPPQFAPPWVEDAKLEGGAQSYVDGLLAGWRDANRKEGLQAVIIGAVRAPEGAYVDILVFGVPGPSGPSVEDFSNRLAQGSIRYFSIECGDSRIPVEPRSLPPSEGSGILHVSHSLVEPAIVIEQLEGGGQLVVRRCGLRASKLYEAMACSIVWSASALQELAPYAQLSHHAPLNSLE